MIPPIRKCLISLFTKNPSHLRGPLSSCSISIFFSSAAVKPGKSNPRISLLDYLVKEQGFSQEAASKASSAITYLRKPRSSESVLSFLKEIGFSQTHIEEVVTKAPVLLSSSLEKTIKPKIKLFQDLGFTSADIAEIISGDPWILTRSVDNRIGPSILVLKSILGSNKDVCRVLKISGWFLKHDLEKSMMPNIEYMKSIGISSSQIAKYVFNFPRFFLLKLESIQECVKRVDEMRFDMKSKMLLHAIRAMSSMTVENWNLKLKLFRSLGFTENDILTVFRRVPQVFAVSERKIKDVTELLLSVRNHDISFVVNHPELLVCSVERRLKPRLEVIEILENKNLFQKKPSLTTVCKISDKEFLVKFVIPYSDELSSYQLHFSVGSFGAVHEKN
ncbi:Transcription termination factor like [Quillaja saponaria]|uniref:Transcription termination factor like n=1 Tax=Quillaja saponaria TaxID=32244 RepID=A0AAD7LWM4_QUISA|nr:Transcription termination factor like [Quillaja saponaria]KAJ7965692.1 Transcription termination factor like [Quillaja saponaria]